MVQETFAFQTEVSRLLDIVARSLYSHKEIFVRELISNASDACDRLRYAALTDPGLFAGDAEFRIRLAVDPEARTLAVIDNGIGMNRMDLVENLGTIARSGTQDFLSRLTGDTRKDLALIGQFGVGFYSAFMVADRVEVITRRAGEAQAWRWQSDGQGAYIIEEAERDSRGTTVTLHLKDDESEFLDGFVLRRIVKTYSDHVGFPIRLADKDGKEETINTASSLWTRPKTEISDDQYKEFYHHVSHNFDDPWHTLHLSAEGVVSYTALLYIPSVQPFDLFNPDRKGHVKLYVRRVFITDDSEGLLPAWLRFLHGVVDSEDLPLNISREAVQRDPRLSRIKSGLVRRVLDDLAKRSSEDPEGYSRFWETFGAVLKEGIYEDHDNRDRLLSLARFRSTAGDGLVSLEDYVGRMREGQKAIYTISGSDAAALARSPHLEGFRAKGIEVLLLTDPVDEFWIPAVRAFQDKPFESATSASAHLDEIAAKTPADETGNPPSPERPGAGDEATGALITTLRAVLGDAVKDVRTSTRLTESAVCLVAAEGDMDLHLERLLRQHRQLENSPGTARILEINPGHPLIRRLAAAAAAGSEGAGTPDLTLTDAAFLLFDQAKIIEGEPVADPVAFSRRLAAVMEQGFALPAA